MDAGVVLRYVEEVWSRGRANRWAEFRDEREICL